MGQGALGAELSVQHLPFPKDGPWSGRPGRPWPPPGPVPHTSSCAHSSRLEKSCRRSLARLLHSCSSLFTRRAWGHRGRDMGTCTVVGGTGRWGGETAHSPPGTQGGVVPWG